MKAENLPVRRLCKRRTLRPHEVHKNIFLFFNNKLTFANLAVLVHKILKFFKLSDSFVITLSLKHKLIAELQKNVSFFISLLYITSCE